MKRLLIFGILCAYALGSTWDAKEPRSDDEEIWVHRDSSPSTPMLRKMPEYVENFELYANDAMTIGTPHPSFTDMSEQETQASVQEGQYNTEHLAALAISTFNFLDSNFSDSHPTTNGHTDEHLLRVEALEDLLNAFVALLVDLNEEKIETMSSELVRALFRAHSVKLLEMLESESALLSFLDMNSTRNLIEQVAERMPLLLKSDENVLNLLVAMRHVRDFVSNSFPDEFSSALKVLVDNEAAVLEDLVPIERPLDDLMSHAFSYIYGTGAVLGLTFDTEHVIESDLVVEELNGEKSVLGALWRHARGKKEPTMVERDMKEAKRFIQLLSTIEGVIIFSERFNATNVLISFVRIILRMAKSLRQFKGEGMEAACPEGVDGLFSKTLKAVQNEDDTGSVPVEDTMRQILRLESNDHDVQVLKSVSLEGGQTLDFFWQKAEPANVEHKDQDEGKTALNVPPKSKRSKGKRRGRHGPRVELSHEPVNITVEEKSTDQTQEEKLEVTAASGNSSNVELAVGTSRLDEHVQQLQMQMSASNQEFISQCNSANFMDLIQNSAMPRLIGLAVKGYTGIDVILCLSLLLRAVSEALGLVEAVFGVLVQLIRLLRWVSLRASAVVLSWNTEPAVHAELPSAVTVEVALKPDSNFGMSSGLHRMFKTGLARAQSSREDPLQVGLRKSKRIVQQHASGILSLNQAILMALLHTVYVNMRTEGAMYRALSDSDDYSPYAVEERLIGCAEEIYNAIEIGHGADAAAELRSVLPCTAVGEILMALLSPVVFTKTELRKQFERFTEYMEPLLLLVEGNIEQQGRLVRFLLDDRNDGLLPLMSAEPNDELAETVRSFMLSQTQN